MYICMMFCVQLLAVQERRPARAPRPLAAILALSPSRLASAAAVYSTAGAASLVLWGRMQLGQLDSSGRLFWITCLIQSLGS